MNIIAANTSGKATPQTGVGLRPPECNADDLQFTPPDTGDPDGEDIFSWCKLPLILDEALSPRSTTALQTLNQWRPF